jgi:hypothetical protein
MIEVAWRQELVRLIDVAEARAKALYDDPLKPEPNLVMIQRTRTVLAVMRKKTIDCHIPPPNGSTTLGLARGVLDWIDDRATPLVRAVGAIERHYLTIPADDARFPTLPALTLVRIFADGSTKPPIADGQALITIQDKSIFHVGIWRCGDFGGHKEAPVNEAALKVEAATLVSSQAAQLLSDADNTNLICPPELTERMVWPADQWPRDNGLQE